MISVCPRGKRFLKREHNDSWCAFCYWFLLIASYYLFCLYLFIKQLGQGKKLGICLRVYLFWTTQSCLTLSHMSLPSRPQPLNFSITTRGKETQFPGKGCFWAPGVTTARKLEVLFMAYVANEMKAVSGQRNILSINDGYRVSRTWQEGKKKLLT